jgi:serine/threonine-protein kinase
MRIVKVLDFGISKTALTGSIFGDDLPLVKTLNLMGTPLYMSPEQVRSSADVDERSDIWALGLVLYALQCGQTAFTGASITEICAAILESAPRPLEAFRNDLPAGLLPIIGKCLAKNAADRYQTVADFALALMPFGPKRSRLNVERAVSVLQAAGKLDPSLEVQSTAPASSVEALRASSSAIPPMARLPSISTLPPRTPTTLPPDIESASSGLLPVELEQTATRTEIDVRAMRRRRSPAIALVVAAIIAIGIAAVVVSRTTSEPAQPSARVTPEPVPTSIVAEQPTTVAERPTAPAPLPSVVAKPAVPRHVPGVAARTPAAPPRPTTSQAAAAAQPVKVEKKAGSNAGEEPDLGY